nr:hypothetical protein [Acidianus brierleyi]
MAIEDRIYRLIELLLYVAKEESAEVTATKLQKIFNIARSFETLSKTFLAAYGTLYRG